MGCSLFRLWFSTPIADEALQIASLTSWPQDGSCDTTLSHLKGTDKRLLGRLKAAR